MLPGPIRKKAVESRPRMKLFWNPIVRVSSEAPSTGPTVLPKEIPRATGSVRSPTVRFMVRAPRKIPGQQDSLHTKSAANAMPEGGQNKMMLESIYGMLNPSFPPAK